MKYNLTLSFICILSLIGCGISHRQVRRTLSQTQERYPQLSEKTYLQDPHHAESSYQPELDMDEAVRIALEYNPRLQAFLEKFGVTAAELADAGLYSNPEAVFTVLKPPESEKHSMSFEIYQNISDFWQVPFLERVARYEQHATQHDVIRFILETIKETKKAYITYVHAQKDAEIVERIYKDIRDLQKQLHKHDQDNGLNQLDDTVVDVRVEEWYRTLQRAYMKRDKAHSDLEQMLGREPQGVPYIDPQSTFFIQDIAALPDYTIMRELAYARRPEVRQREQQVQQYQSQIRYEQSHVFPYAELGAFFTDDTSGRHFRGPVISFEIPMWDANQPRIRRAYYLMRQSEKNLQDQYYVVAGEVARTRAQLIALRDIFYRYQSVTLERIEQGFTYAKQYAQQQRINVLTLIDTSVRLHQERRTYYETLRDIWLYMIDLEREAGIDLNEYITPKNA